MNLSNNIIKLFFLVIATSWQLANARGGRGGGGRGGGGRSGSRSSGFRLAINQSINIL